MSEHSPTGLVPLPPERLILLVCARKLLGYSPEDWPADAARLDWPLLLLLATEQRVLPLLHRGLSQSPLRPPRAFEQELQTLTRNIAGRNLLLCREMLAVSERLASNGIPAIVFKGPALAALLSGDLLSRAFHDLDLLVRREQLPQAARLLAGLDYRLCHPSRRALDAVHLRTEYHFPFHRTAGDVALELHGELLPYYFACDLPMDGVWSRAQRVAVGGGSVLTLADEDLFVALCLHAAKHAWRYLAHLCDVALLVARRPALDWAGILAAMSQRGQLRILLVTLRLCHLLLGLPWPEPVRPETADGPAVAAISSEVMTRYAGGSNSLPPVPGAPLFHLRCRERWRDRARYCLRSAFAPNWEELAWVLLPRPLFPLYWILRPLRLVRSYTPALMRLLARRRAAPQLAGE